MVFSTSLVSILLLGLAQVYGHAHPQVTPAQGGGGGGGGGGGSGASKQLSPPLALFAEPMPIPAFHVPKALFPKPDGSGDIVYYEVEIINFTQQIFPGLPPTMLVGYNGVSPGPSFNMTVGVEALVRFTNMRSDPFAKATSVHLHGSDTHPPWDGWAEDLTPVGFYKDYYYPNNQRARTLWYHDHAIDHTAENDYFGLAGQYILHDQVELNLGLPEGNFDLPFVLAAKQYDNNAQLVQPLPGVSMFGDIIHVNGQPWPFFDVQPRKYRFRVLDVGISRAYRLYLVSDFNVDEDDTANHIPFFVVGSDSGTTAMPVSTPDLYISVAERWEIIIDFAPFAGSSIFMKNFFVVEADTPFENTNAVIRFDVGTTVLDNTNNGPLPATFDPLPLPPMAGKDLNNPDHIFTFERKNDEWKINGVTFNDVAHRVLARPPRGAVELWKLVNMGGGWSHPIHIHLIDFQVVSRQKGSRGIQVYEAVALQDVVFLGENEEIWVLARYTPFDGLYMFHCHNLVHEDDAMMSSFNVTDLVNFNYPPNMAKFWDPLDPRFISKEFDPATVNTQQAIDVALPFFASLGAYNQMDGLDSALVTFYSTATSVITDTAPVQSEFNINQGTKNKRIAIAEAEAEPTAAPIKN